MLNYNETAQKMYELVIRLENEEELTEAEQEALQEYMDNNACSDGFYYGLTLGGYISPEELLDEESVRKVNEALEIIEEYEDMWTSLASEL